MSSNSIEPNNFMVPDYLDLPWLSRTYVENNGWILAWESQINPNSFPTLGHGTFGLLPFRSRLNYKPGDVLIFDDFNE